MVSLSLMVKNTFTKTAQVYTITAALKEGVNQSNDSAALLFFFVYCFMCDK